MTTNFTISESQQNGGYDLDFVIEPPESLKCILCLCVAREPWQHGHCGRIFCKDCLDAYIKRKSKCPYCREGNPQCFVDNKSKHEILNLIVQCKNKQNGCSWEGDARAAQEHLQFCSFHLVPCPRKCQKKILQKDIKSHLENECINRDYQCPLCGDWGLFGERTSSHLKVCPNRPATCPNEGCKDQVAYHKLDHHAMKDCDYTILKCKYRSIGCSASLMRKDMADHEDDIKNHLNIILETLEELQERSASAELMISAINRQFLPKADAKKLKVDIKQGIEKIYVKCENLQQEVNDFSAKEYSRTAEIKNASEKLELLEKEFQDLKKKHALVEQDSKGLQDRLEKLRQNQDYCSKSVAAMKPYMELQKEIVRVVNNLSDREEILSQRLSELQRFLYIHRQTFAVQRMIKSVTCSPHFKPVFCFGFIFTIVAFVLFTYWF